MKISLRKINSTKSFLNSSSSNFSSFSDNDRIPEASFQNKKVLIYNKSQNKSRNFFKSSSDTISKLALKKRKFKLNKIIDDLDRISKSKPDKRIRSKSNRESRFLREPTLSSFDTSSFEYKNGLKDALLRPKYKLNK